MRSLVFGGTGMLGHQVVREMRRRGHAALGLSRPQADVTDPDRVAYWVRAFAPHVIFNCAAFTQVDACEQERDKAFRVNGQAVSHLAAAAGRADVPLVHVSTDYVFDGDGARPYREDDPTGPRSVYGASKLEGEVQALAYDRSLVVRASWLFGPGGPNFVATMLRFIREGRSPLRVVSDQRGGPTYTRYLARALADLVARGATGIVHYANREPVSWYELTCEIAASSNGSTEVVPVATSEFPRPAPRPAYSVLDVSRFEDLVGRRVERWTTGLEDYLTILRGGAPGLAS